MHILVTVATVIVVSLALAASAMSSDAPPRSTVTAREDVDEFGGTGSSCDRKDASSAERRTRA